jgi:signal transduction histidine kinase
MKSNFNNIILNILTVGFSQEISEYTKSKLILLSVFSYIGIALFVIFGVIHIMLGNLLIGYTELSISVITLANIVILRMTKNVINSSRLVIFITIIALLFLFLTGGLEQTGIFWYYTLPIIAFFLRGKKEGIVWVSILILATLLAFFIQSTGYLTIPYSFITIRQLLYSVLVVTVFIYFYQDMNETNQKIIENRSEKLLASNKQLEEEIEKSKTEFVTLASHQLRTPITAIGWFTEILLNGDAGKITSEQRDQLQQIYLSNQRMAALINDLLIASQLELGAIIMHNKKVDLPALAHSILNKVTAEYTQHKKLIVKEKYEKDIQPLFLDPDLIKIVFEHLFSNACKYTPENATIQVSINHEKTTQGKINITVSDTGYGIPARQQAKIFTKLFRAENIKSKETDGTGIGLYIAKSIIDKMGGEITFQSIEGEGTTFTVTLPERDELETVSKG